MLKKILKMGQIYSVISSTRIFEILNIFDVRKFTSVKSVLSISTNSRFIYSFSKLKIFVLTLHDDVSFSKLICDNSSPNLQKSSN